MTPRPVVQSPASRTSAPAPIRTLRTPGDARAVSAHGGTLERAAEAGERQARLGRVRALVALPAAGAGQRLVHVLDREDAERARHAGAELHVHDPACRFGADVVVVRR